MANVLSDIGKAAKTVFGHGPGTVSGTIQEGLKKDFGHGKGSAAGAVEQAIASKVKGGGGGSGSAPDPYAGLESLTPQDIFQGHADLSHLPYNIDTKNDKAFIAFQKANPDLAAAIQQRRAYDWSQLQQTMNGSTSGVGAGVTNPMAVQMLYQSMISPLLNQIQSNQQGNISTYQNMMNQVMGDRTLPGVYRSALSAQLPQNVSNMQAGSAADLQAALSSPAVAALLNQLQTNTAAQQARQRYDVMYGTGPGSALQAQTGQVGGGVVLTDPTTGKAYGA